jgi:hypothetical protein
VQGRSDGAPRNADRIGAAHAAVRVSYPDIFLQSDDYAEGDGLSGGVADNEGVGGREHCAVTVPGNRPAPMAGMARCGLPVKSPQ